MGQGDRRGLCPASATLCHTPPPSPTYERLRDTIDKRMRHVYQPLMLMELLGRRSPAPAQDVARRIRRAWWASFTGNVITRYERGTYDLVGGKELSDAERDQLLELCRQRLDRVKLLGLVLPEKADPAGQGA